MNRWKIAVLASGEGTTTEALVLAGIKDKAVPEVGLVICNNPKAGIFKRVENLNKKYDLKIRTVLINSHTQASTTKLIPGRQTLEEEEAILKILKAGHFDLVLLFGYMKKIGPSLIREFGWRDDYKSPYQAKMLNSHPGLLPDTIGYIGIHVQEQVLESGRAGHSLHVVSAKYDEGPTVAEHKVAVGPHDTAETLFARVQASERQHLPQDLINFIAKRKEYLGARK